MGKLIALASGGKGGVGKSVCAVNIAGALAHKGYRVAVVDTDTGRKDQGDTGVRSLSSWARIRNNLIEQGEELPEITSYTFSPEVKIHAELKDIKVNNDFVILDTPGSTSSALRSAMAIADIIYLPMNCTRDEFLPLPPIFKLAKGVEEMLEIGGYPRKLDLRILPCRVDNRYKHDRGEFIEWYYAVASDIASISGVTIPYAKAFTETASYGISLHDEKNKYRASIDLLVDEINGERKLSFERS